MLLSGFTFIRNAIKYDFPIIEAVKSMLPLVDELVINVGRSEDGTEDLIAGIRDPKIRILHSVWDDSKTDSGLVLSEQTNIALAACRSPWALYLQGDEAIHEREHQLIRKAVELESDEQQPADGFRFRYLHFYGGYSLIQRPWNWYPSEIRIVRTDRGITSFGDAQTFRTPDGAKLATKLLPAHMFHYGHAREPEKMKRKISYFHRFWHGDEHGIATEQAYDLNMKNLVWYWGTHPAPYKDRISKSNYSPTPEDLPQGSDQVFIYGGGNRELASKLEALLRRHGKRVIVEHSFWRLIKYAWRHILIKSTMVFVDLVADKHSPLFLLFGGFDCRLAFKQRVAHAPSGKLWGPLAKLYTTINWGSHEVRAEGFRVPAHVEATQLAAWLGVVD